MPSPLDSLVTHDTPVLVVKDDFHICQMLVEVLTLEGYRVKAAQIADDIAQAAAHALDALQHAARPTIILADPISCMIQGAEDLDVYLHDAVRRQPHLLYMLTPLCHAADAVACFHADGVITYPIGITELLAAIADGERILRERAVTSPDPFTINL